jgi:cyanate permease
MCARNAQRHRAVAMTWRRREVVIAFVIAWCLLVVAAIVAASTRRFEGWDIYLLTAAVVVGLAIAIAIALLPSRERGNPAGPAG